IVAKVAIIILFFGVSFLLKYSIDHGLLSPEIRVLGSLILGLALFAIGWRFRNSKKLYSLILQGGGVGVLYLSIFAAFKLYALIPVAAAFVLLVVICALSVIFAILQNAISLSILAFVGAYLSPVLLSSGRGEHIILFCYYTLISLALVAISRWRSWRVLNLIGFLFTVVVVGSWYDNSYDSEFYIATQLFLIANLLIFGILAVLLFVRNEKLSQYHNVIDITLLFGVPILSYALQYGIVEHLEFGAAFSALFFALFYIAGSFFVFKKFKDIGKKAAFYMLGLGIGFATLAVPLAFDDDLTSLIWLVEGTAITWAALSNKQFKLGYFGLLITIFGAVLLLRAGDVNYMRESLFITLYGCSSAILLFNACVFNHFKELHSSFKITRYILLSAAAFFWVRWILVGCDLVFATADAKASTLAAFIVSSWLWYFIGKKQKWDVLGYAPLSLWPVLLFSLTRDAHHSWLIEAGYLAAFVSAYFYLFKNENLQKIYKHLELVLHISLLWIVFKWIYDNVDFLMYHFMGWGYEALEWSVFTTVFSALVLLVYLLQKKAIFPFALYRLEYWLAGLAPVVLYLAAGLLRGLGFDGHIVGWRYIPLLNPLEEGAIFALIVLVFYFKRVFVLLKQNALLLEYQKNLKSIAAKLLGALIFLWANSVVLRFLSDILDISWSFYYLWQDSGVHTVFSFIWTLLALVLIIIANRRKSRKIWFAGMGLLAVVVAKLVLHDSVHLEGLFRAFVFIGVALLMLLIGFLAPIPPKNIENKKD
ncbi:MAG: DUF2339 domain-containing protein, partial [Campylobacteraceae bacterium]|nr:DUF2339 domain-containing protein [Campylobacteraceae bacterium]